MHYHDLDFDRFSRTEKSTVAFNRCWERILLMFKQESVQNLQLGLLSQDRGICVASHAE